MERGDSDVPQRPTAHGPLVRYWPLWAGLAALLVLLIGGIVPVLVGGTPGAGTTPQGTGTGVLPGSYVPPSGQLPGSATSAAGPAAVPPPSAPAASGPTGAAQLVGPRSDLKLSLRLSHLPSTSGGYAVWLATPGVGRAGGASHLLGRLNAAAPQGVFRLPHGPAAYRLLEITRYKSGVPVLTAPNPARPAGPGAGRSVQLRETASRSSASSTSK